MTMYEDAIKRIMEVDNIMNEEIKDTRNIDELKKYLKANGLDEYIAEMPYFIEKFKIERRDGTRYFVYCENDGDIIFSHNRDQTGHHTEKSNFRIRKIGKVILIEELHVSDPVSVHYMMDDPIGMDNNHRQVDIFKKTTYLDEKGTDLLAEELRTYTLDSVESSNNMPTEKDLYSKVAKVEYSVNQENIEKALKDDYDSKTPGGYQIVEKIREMDDLQKENKKLTKMNKENLQRLTKAVNFVEKIKSSRIGKIFFGKGLKALDEPMDDDRR